MLRQINQTQSSVPNCKPKEYLTICSQQLYFLPLEGATQETALYTVIAVTVAMVLMIICFMGVFLVQTQMVNLKKPRIRSFSKCVFVTDDAGLLCFIMFFKGQSLSLGRPLDILKVFIALQQTMQTALFCGSPKDTRVI